MTDTTPMWTTGCTRLLLVSALLLALGPALPAAAQTCGDGIVEGLEQCDDGNVVPGDGCSEFCLTEATNCLNDFAMFNNPTCTANDVKIALIINASDAVCELGTLVELDLLAQLEAGSDERYDIGTWIALDGGDAKAGTCDHDFLNPTTDLFDQVCSISKTPCAADSDCPILGEQCLDTNYNPGGPSPPYTCLDPFETEAMGTFCAGTDFHDGEEAQDPPDVCADLQQGVDAFFNIGQVLLPCVDTDGDSRIDIGTCVSWENNPNTVESQCRGVDDAIPGTPSKCRCETQNIGNVFVAAKIVVVKQTDPDGDPATFEITVSENTSPSATLLDTFLLGDDESGEVGGLFPTALSGTTYSVAETVPAGWDLTSVDCVSDQLNPVPDETAISLASGETVTCTFNNRKEGRIIVEKQTLPDGDPATFDFTGDLAGTIGDGGTLEMDVDPGQYSTTEAVPAGWNLTSIVCDDDDSSGDLGTATATFEVAAGETVKCIFTNTKNGKIIVEKQTLPDGDPATFDFTGEIVTTLGDGQTDMKEVEPGSYSITETVPDGWNLTDISCDDDDSSGDLGTDTASYEVAPGETVTCVFTNTKDGKIIVEKQTLPDGDPALFTFSGDLAGSIGDGGTLMQSVSPGSYASTETVPAGWDLISIVCDDGNSSGAGATANFNVEPGETVTCVFTNRKDGKIIVMKETIPDGDPTLFTFGGALIGDIGDGGMLMAEVDPGQYVVTEVVPDLWDLTSIACTDGDSGGVLATASATYNVDPGEIVTCVFTNTKRGMAMVNKTESGTLPLSKAHTFEIREGASTTSEGVVLATGAADINTGEVIFACAGVPDEDCRMVEGVAKFPPGTYQLCETGMMAAWMNNLDGFTPLGATPEGGDNSTECVDFTLDAGETETFNVDNTPPPEGDARTIGFWKNWTSCDGSGNQDPVLDETLMDGIFLWGMDPDGFLVDSCEEAVDLLDKREIASELVVADGDKLANDAAYGMAAQLLAALLNIKATAGTCPDLFTAVNEAQALLERIGFDGQGAYLTPNPNQSDLLNQPDPDGGTFTRSKLRDLRQMAETLAGILDAYNNNELCL